MEQPHPSPAPPIAMGYLHQLRRAFLVSTIIAVILLIPNAAQGFRIDGIIITLLSSYAIGLTSASFVWLLMRLMLPLVLRRNWPPLRAWALASMAGSVIATSCR
jgi:hypothetical protein